MSENYEKILQKISRTSNLDKGELERRIEAKREKLSGLISKEGAAQVVAAELGISFENELLKINELLSGMKKVNVLGKVIRLFPVRTFSRKGKESKVVNFVIADETSNIKVVLWDVNHIELIEKEKIKEGSVVEIRNASMRENEIHLGSFSEFNLSNEVLENVKTEKIVREKSINDLRISDSASIRAFIVQAFNPNFFNVCPECNRKVNQEGDGFVCEKHGKVIPQERALMNIVLDDGTETVRALLFSEQISQLGIDLKDKGKIFDERQKILGEERIFLGDARKNNYFDNMELIVDESKKPDLDNLISELEK